MLWKMSSSVFMYCVIILFFLVVFLFLCVFSIFFRMRLIVIKMMDLILVVFLLKEMYWNLLFNWEMLKFVCNFIYFEL